jgi:fructose-1,6-bisphosphatase II
MADDHMPRYLGFDLARATELTALAAGRWMGLNDQTAADRAAAVTMNEALSAIEMDGQIVMGEDVKHSSGTPLHAGQSVGTGHGPAMDVVADAIDGCRLLAQGHGTAVSVAAAAPRDTLWAPVPAVYMDKIVAGKEVGAALVSECMDAPAAWTLALVARAKGRRVSDLVVFVLARPRHEHLITEIRRAGARVILSPDGDIVGALLATTPDSGVDLLMGIGGVPEGLMAACAVRASGGAMLGRLAPQSAGEREAVQAAGLDTRRILTSEELVSSNQEIGRAHV